MTVYLFHVVEEKSPKSLFFCKLEETFKEPVLSRGCDFVAECFRKLRAWFILDRVQHVKTSIAPQGIQAKISLLTLLRERRNSDLAKDIFRQEENLSPPCATSTWMIWALLLK